MNQAQIPSPESLAEFPFVPVIVAALLSILIIR